MLQELFRVILEPYIEFGVLWKIGAEIRVRAADQGDERFRMTGTSLATACSRLVGRLAVPGRLRSRPDC
jgi:hypothetical protein